MDRTMMLELSEKLLQAWNSHEVDRVLACYTADLEYRDPNTRGAIHGGEAMGRYLAKLFARWQMHWSLREAHLFDDGRGCAVLWHATFRRSQDDDATVAIDGIDFVEMRGDRVLRNEVCFDRAQLAALAAV